MTEHTTTRLQSLDEPAFAALRRTDFAAFVVTLADGRIVAATPPCEPLGLRSDTPAPLSVKAVTRAMGGDMGHPPRLERIRLPNAFVPRLFSCATLPSALGPVVLFVDPASMESGEAPEAVPAAPEPVTSTQTQRPIRFTWEMDHAGRVTSVSQSILQALQGFGDWRGRTFAEMEEDGMLRDAAAATAALEVGATFANVVLLSAETPSRRIEIGGVPLVNAMRTRIGWRGFGLIWPSAPGIGETGVSNETATAFAPNVVPLRGGNLSPRERSAFDEIARTLSDAIEGWPKGEEPAPATPPPAPAGPMAGLEPAVAPGASRAQTEEPLPPAEMAASFKSDDGDGQAWDAHLLDRLPIGIAVQQDGDIVFLNETLLAWLALENLTAFRNAGGFGALLKRDAASEPLRLRTLSGDSAVDVRLIRTSWQRKPAVIHVLRLVEEAVRSVADTGGASDDANARQAALDLFGFPLLVLDRAGSMVQANAAAAHLCGFPASELEGEPFTLLLAPESQKQAVALLDEALAGVAQPAPIALVTRSRTGERRRVEATLSRATGTPPCVCLALRIVPETTEKPASAEPSSGGDAAAYEDGLGHFVRRVSHGVRSPLTGILGFVESVRASTFGPVGNSRYARQAEAAALAAQQLLTTLEDIEVLAQPIGTDAVESVEISGVVASAVLHLTPSMKRRRQIIRSDVAEALVARINEDILAFLIRSVLEEAIRATPGGGQIMVSATKTEEDRLCILIRDSGPTLTEPQIAQALSPFQPATASDRFSSSGRPFRMARLAAVLKANGGEMRLRRGIETGMLCELHLPT